MTGFEEFIFENRNKKYGSYDLRKKYPKYIIWGFFLSIFLIFGSAAGIFIASNSDVIFESEMPRNVSVESIQLLSLEDLELPKPVSAEAQNAPDLSNPEIADTTYKEPEKKTVAKTVNQVNADSLAKESEGKIAGDGTETGDSLLYLKNVEMPEFAAGGKEGLGRFFRDNISQSIKKSKASRKIIVQFSVTKNGEVKDVLVVMGADPLVNKEVVRVLSMMPRWKPGKQAGRPVDFRLSMPINI